MTVRLSYPDYCEAHFIRAEKGDGIDRQADTVSILQRRREDGCRDQHRNLKTFHLAQLYGV